MRPLSALRRDARGAARLAAALALAVPCGALAVRAADPVPSPSASVYPGDSLYQLRLALTDQHGAAVAVDRHAGHLVLVSMFYASCPYVCPTLVQTIQATERALGPDATRGLRVLLVSFDELRDTPAVLAKISERHRVDASRWTIARADAGDVRLLAAALGIQYRRLPDGEFNHATVVTLLDERGRPVARSSVLGNPDPELLAALRRVR